MTETSVSPRPTGDLRLAKWKGSARALFREWPRTLIFAGVFLTTSFFIIYPFGILFHRSLYNRETNVWSLDNYAAFFSEPELFGAFLLTLKLAIFVSIFCLIIALPMAWGVARTNMPLKGLVRSLVVLTFATPSFMGAIGWIALAGPNAGFLNEIAKWLFNLEQGPFNIFSFEGMVFVLSLYVYPFLFFNVVSALDNMDPGLEQAARILGASNLRIIRTITLPVVMPAILSGLVLVFLECFVIFGAPAVLGSPKFLYTLSTTVHALFTADPPRFDMAATAATPIVLITVSLLIFQRVYLGKKQYATVRGQANQPQPVDIGRWVYLMSAFCVGVVVIGVLLPWLALLQASIIETWGHPITWSNLSLVHYRELLDDRLVYRAFRNSFGLALVAAFMAVIFSFILAWSVERSTFIGKEAIAVLAMMPLAFPGVALGTALVFAFWDTLYGTIWLFLIAYTIKGMPFGFMFARSALRQVHEELEQSSRALGAGPLKTLKKITLPLVKKGLLSVGSILFAQKFRDAQTSIMLYTGGLEVVAILVLDYVEESDMGLLGAMTFLVLCVNFTLVLTARKLVGKASYEL